LDVRGSADTCAVDVFDQVEVTWEGTNDWGKVVEWFGGEAAAAVSEESAGTTQNACSSFLQDSTTARQQPKNRPSKTVKRASQTLESF
jgi:hypothetical protein